MLWLLGFLVQKSVWFPKGLLYFVLDSILVYATPEGSGHELLTPSFTIRWREFLSFLQTSVFPLSDFYCYK